jgi:prepilin-type N-terminal cleavage/methylation domain-containing protein
MKMERLMRRAEYRVTNNQDGFTLIEIIITLVVLSIAVAGMLSVFTTAITGSANPAVLNRANALAQEQMDTIIGDRMNSARGFAYIIPGNYPADVPVTGFNRSVNIFCVNPAALDTDNGVAPGGSGCASGYTHVEVTVAHAAIGSVTLDGLVTNY